MKTILALILFNTLAFAKVSLEVPVVGYRWINHKSQNISVAKMNKELAKLGLDGIPEVVTVSQNPERFYKVLERRFEAAKERLQWDMHFNIWADGTGDNYLYKWENVCYRGEITEVPALIKSMQGNFLNQDEGLLAFGAGPKKVIEDEAFKSSEGLKERFDSEYENLEAEIDQWLNYSSKSKTVLVMSDYGPQGDGTELEVTEIPPCK